MMMQTTTNELLNFLEQKTHAMMAMANTFATLGPGQLNFKPTADKWSILQCMEHLNLYGDYYLPEIEKQILAAPATPAALTYKSGWLGNYFVKTMQPSGKGQIKKMKSPKDKTPAQDGLALTTIQRFTMQQQQLLKLFKMAAHTDMQKVKIPVSIAPFIKIRLGDCFRFIVAHNERHMLQAEKLL